jgi:hypothetical protein
MRFPLAAPLLTVLALGSCSITFFGNERASRSEDLHHVAGSGINKLRVDGFNGDIVVVAGDSAHEVRAHAETFARGGSQAEAVRRLAEMQWTFHESGNTLFLELSQSDGGSNNCGSELIGLQVPSTWTLDLDTSNGDVEVPAGFDTVLISTSNGDLEIAADGKVRARTSNGDVDFVGKSQDFNLRSSNGDMTLDLQGDWNGHGIVDSSNGRISVRCSGVMDCALRGSTSNGKVRVYGPPLEEGSGSLSLDTSNSNISVTHGGER